MNETSTSSRVDVDKEQVGRKRKTNPFLQKDSGSSSGSISNSNQQSVSVSVSESAKGSGGKKKKYVKVNSTLLDKQMNSIARAGLLRSTTANVHAPDPEQNAPPGETDAQRRRRMDRISGRRKRARKIVELEGLHQQMVDLKERNDRLKRENQGFRDTIAEIKKAQESGAIFDAKDLLGNNAKPPAVAVQATTTTNSGLFRQTAKDDVLRAPTRSAFPSASHIDNTGSSTIPTDLTSLLALSSAVHSQQNRLQQSFRNPQAHPFLNTSSTSSSSLQGIAPQIQQQHRLAALFSGNALLPQSQFQLPQAQAQAQRRNQLLSALAFHPFSMQLPQTQNQGSTVHASSQFYGHSSSSSPLPLEQQQQQQQQRLLSSLFSAGMPQSSSGNHSNDTLINIRAILQQQQQQQVRKKDHLTKSGALHLQQPSPFQSLFTQGHHHSFQLQSQTLLQAAAASRSPATTTAPAATTAAADNHQQQSSHLSLLLSHPSVSERVQRSLAAAPAPGGGSGSHVSLQLPNHLSAVPAGTPRNNSTMPNTTTAAAAADRPSSPPPTNVKELKIWMERHKKRLQEERESRK